MSRATTPSVLDRPLASALAAVLGRYPSWSIAARTRARVSWRTLGWLFSTLETVWWDTPARLATSAMEGGRWVFESANISQMTSHGYAIGVDFGTGSARTLLLDLRSGEELALCELAYPHGVIDDILPETHERLPLDWALHDPDDYRYVLEAGIQAVLTERPDAASGVVGIGIDATSCTVLPVTADGTPLCELAMWRARPHVWPKLWKHHAAQHVANRLNEVALERKEAFLARYGGRISSEWYFPKLIEIWLEDRGVYDASAAFIEVADWVVWYLSGHQRRSACPAAYKALWSEADGIPSAAYFDAAYPGFSEPAAKLGSQFFPLGSSAGPVRPDLARKLGLPDNVAVAVGNVDSFVSFPGAGAEGAGTYVMVIGTSICDLVVHPTEITLPGITGVAKDGIVPGLFGYEAGQPAVGDMLGWFADLLSGAWWTMGPATGFPPSNGPPPRWPRPQPGWSPSIGGTGTAACWATPTCPGWWPGSRCRQRRWKSTAPCSSRSRSATKRCSTTSAMGALTLTR